jgi:hypothetical protein
MRSSVGGQKGNQGREGSLANAVCEGNVDKGYR